LRGQVTFDIDGCTVSIFNTGEIHVHE
jgi:hypothetical protein